MTGPDPLTLSIWTVYRRPTDFPFHYVARRWDVRDGQERATDVVLLAPTLEELRGKLPPMLTMIPRQPGDDPVVVEVWL